jgi:hypothetical protein
MSRRQQEIDALAASSNHLRALHIKLSKARRAQVPGLPQRSPVPMRVDDRFTGGVLTRGRKSTQPVDAVNRIATEFYPIAPPRVDFVTGANTRLIGREHHAVY